MADAADRIGDAVRRLSDTLTAYANAVRTGNSTAADEGRRVLEDLGEVRASTEGLVQADGLGWVPPVTGAATADLSDEQHAVEAALREETALLTSATTEMQHRTWIFTVDDGRRFVRAGSERLDGATGDTVEDVLDDLCAAEVQWPDWDAYAEMGVRLELESFGAYRVDRSTR